MSRIDWHAFCVKAWAAGFQPLFRPIMMWLAKWLPVVAVPEQHLVTTMRLNMVDHGSRRYAPKPGALGAEGMLAKETEPCPLPAGIVAPLCRACPGIAHRHRVTSPRRASLKPCGELTSSRIGAKRLVWSACTLVQAASSSNLLPLLRFSAEGMIRRFHGTWRPQTLRPCSGTMWSTWCGIPVLRDIALHSA